MSCNRYHQIGRSIVGAVALAVNAVNDDPMLLPGRTLQYVLRDSECMASVGSSELAHLLETPPNRDPIRALIGPGCNSACEVTAVLTDGADIPQISPMCDSPVLSDKQLYPTVRRLP